MPTKPIVVIGSINMDLVCRVHRMPLPGQTLLGEQFITVPGGKGANQAVAAAKLGARCHMIGRVGEDDFGERLLNGLKQHGVRTDHVTITEGVPSGVAMILVDRRGENSIVVAPGANHRVRPADVEAASDLIASAGAVVMQLEVPVATIRYAAELCRRLGVFTILDPAPAPLKGLPASLWEVDILSPNQSEAVTLLGASRATGRLRRTKRIDARQIGSELMAGARGRGPAHVVLKLGAKGAMVVDRGQIEHVRGFRVRVVDSTAAGDAFTGALAVGLAEGMELPRAVRFANAAGAACCRGFGAQPSLPSRQVVQDMLGSPSP